MIEHVASDGIRLNLEVEEGGANGTVVLVHGLAGSIGLAWKMTGITAHLVAQGVRVVSFDLRGHGRSDKPHDQKYYGDQRMVSDLAEIVDAFAGRAAVVVGYSMGAALTLLALERGLDIGGAVVGAAAPAVLGWSPEDQAMRSAAVAALDGTVEPDEAMQGWLGFLDAIGADRTALARVLDGHRPVVTHWENIRVPVAVVAGDDDAMAAPPEQIAVRISGSRAVVVPGDHLSAPASAQFRDTVLAAVRSAPSP